MLGSGKPELVDAIGYVVSQWLKRGLQLPPTLLQPMLRFTEEQSEEALASTGVLSALARLSLRGHSNAEGLLSQLAESVRGPANRTQLISAAGFAIEPSALVQIVSDVQESQEAEEEYVLAALFHEHPEIREDLFLNGYIGEYLYALELNPTDDDDTIARLVSLLRGGNTELASRAVELASLPSLRGRVSRALDHDRNSPGMSGWEFEEVLGWEFEEELDKVVASGARRVRSGRSTGYRLGDAIYRDLIARFGNAEHWHDCLYLGWKPVFRGGVMRAEMRAIQAAQGIGWSDTYAYVVTNGALHLAGADMTRVLAGMQDTFLTLYREHKPKRVHGARTRTGI